MRMFKSKQTEEITEGAIKNGQSRETGNTGYTGQVNVREYRRGNKKTDNPEVLGTESTQKHVEQ